VATLPSIAVKLMPEMIGAFRREYPGVSVHLLDANASGVQARVRRKEVDFGLASQWQLDEDLQFDTVMRDPFRVVCRRDHPLAAGEGPLSWADLAEQDFLGLAPDTGIRPLIEAIADLPASVRQPPVEVSNIATLEGMLTAGLGVTVLPELALPSDPDGHLTSRPLHGPALSRELCVITRRGRSLSPAAQSLRDLIVSRLAGDPVGD
jgi:DNA-binding transcriptional LysR family regulator